MTARNLSRNVAAVLDEVEIERATLLVTRGGRSAAVMAPVPRSGMSSLAIDESKALLKVVVLSPLERRMLLKAARRAPQTVNYSEMDSLDSKELQASISRLENDDLLTRVMAGFDITEKGKEVAAVLRARAADGG